MTLTWLHLFFFIYYDNDYFLSNTERSNSVLSICCVAGVKGAACVCLAGDLSSFFPLFWEPLKHFRRAPDGFLW